MKKYILIISVVLTFCFACEDPYGGKSFAAYDENPTSTYLDSRPDDFSLWVELLHHADLYNALNQSSSTFTCFVPNNKAMEALLAKKGVSSVSELKANYAQQLIYYHVINDEVTQKELLATNGKLTSATVSGDYLSISYGESGGQDSVYVNDEANITELALETTNGLVYVLDVVLSPLIETLYDRVDENSSYSIFKDAIAYTGWDEILNSPYDTVYNQITKTESVIKKNYTLFVVPDDVYKANAVNNINDLISYLGASADYTDSTNALYNYVGYHMLASTHYTSELFESDMDTTILWATMAENEVLSSNIVDGENYINYSESAGSGISLLNSNIEAKNGTIHEVDNIMPVFTPDVRTVIWDLCNYSDVESVINEFGKDNNIGNIYQQYQTAEYWIGLTHSEDIMSYEWNQYTSASIKDYPAVGYLLTKAGSGEFGNSYGAYNNDFLVINLGYTGNITMPSPTILKGKYKVELFYACAGSLSDFINGGSKCKFIIDETEQEAYIYKGALASVGVYSMTLFNEIDFDITSPHDFKVVLLDSRAATHSKYRLQLDYVKFTPINE